MNKIINYALLFIISLLNTASFYGVENYSPVNKISAAEKNLSSGQNQDIAEQVKKTFAVIRKNAGKDVQTDEERNSLDNLEKLGEKVVSYLELYLNDVNINVRIAVINLALKIGGDKSLTLIASALRNPKAEIQKRAADGLFINYYYSQYGKILPDKNGFPFDEDASYQSFSPQRIAAVPQIGIGLRESIKSGNATDSAIFLLANFPGTETGEVLRKLSEKRTSRTGRKVSPVTKEVKLAAAITLANADDTDAVRYLSETIGKSDVEPLMFLFTNITEIKSPEVLLFLVKKFDDKTFLEKRMSSQEFVKKFKLPKGSWVDQRPPRRVCDFAVNSFIERFNLKVSFTLHSTTYQDEQISEVRELVKVKLNV